jgi:hypothetical protein
MIFKCRYLSDADIWLRIEKITVERDQVSHALAEAGAETDLEAIAFLSKRLGELDEIFFPVDGLIKLQADFRELEELVGGPDTEGDGDWLELYEEVRTVCYGAAEEVYQLLLDKGYLDEEREDETDLKILNFISFAGPEYAWRLGINIGIDVAEARDRLERLLGKGLLEKVQGTMLEGYHREKSWVKHMNHTYYRLSREGELFLRNLHRENRL